MVTVMINKKNIPMEVDTGAALSLISEETFNSHFNFTELQPTDVQLRTYSGELISALGSLDVEVEYESQTASVTNPSVESVLNKRPDVFKDDLGDSKD